MTDETIDLSGEQDATERMTELQERSHPDTDNERKAEFVGTESTEDDDIESMMEHL